MELTTVVKRGHQLQLQRKRVRLKVASGPDAGKAYQGADRQITVGGAEGNSLVLSDPAVSRHHLRLQARDNGYLLTDLDSTNGTVIAGARVLQALLYATTELRVGETTLVFEVTEEHDSIPLPAVSGFGELAGESTAMRELFAQLYQLAEHNVTVLLEGETGTGKELIASEIHAASLRKDGPYIVVDCGAIADSLVHSELFGHKRGAFTGAETDREGAFEAADGGTIFLDEIGELDISMQTLLLRALESGEIRRAGETQYRKVDVRVVAATHRDLRGEINQGRFREDLFYRLSVIQLRVPPLRERTGDVEVLARRMLPALAEKLGATSIPEISAEQLAKLSNHDWPGNVRELRNVLERMLVFKGEISGITEPEPGDEPSRSAPDGALLDLPFTEGKTAWQERFEKAYVTHWLAKTNGNATEGARQTGMARSHFFRLMKRHGIER